MPIRDSELPVWLLRSRAAPPRQLQRLIRRGRIVKALCETKPGQLVILSGPPGFGKSVALSQWYSAAKEEGMRCAWLAIDTTDDPPTAIQYLAFACHSSGLDVARAGILTRRDASPHPPLDVQSLLSCIEQDGARWLLVIDDAERASPEVLATVLHPLTRFFPSNLTLGLASRDPGLLDVSELKQRGLVRSMGSSALRFDREEIRELWGRTTTQSQIRAVEQRSGGWPALVQLMLEYGSLPQFDTTATPATGAAAVTTFFETRLLARLESPLRQALFRLALLDRFTAGLAAELMDVPDVGDLLAQLVACGILTHHETGAEFEVHPLLRGYLAARFAAEQPMEARRLNERAAQAYLRLGHFVQAARQAAATGDLDILGNVIEAMDPLLLGIREGFHRLRQIVRFIPVTLARRRPRLGYACIAGCIKAGRLKEAQALFQDLESSAPAAFATNLSMIEFERAFAHSMLAVYKGTSITERDIEALDSFMSATPSMTPLVRGVVETLRSFVQQQGGQFAEARKSAQRAIEFADDADSSYTAFFMYCDLGMMAGLEGRVAEAFELFDRGDAACLATIRLDERLTSIRDAFRLELDHELDRGNTARRARLKNICVRLPNLEGWLDVYSAAYRTYSEQLYLSGDLGAALAILSAGIDHLNEQEIEGAPAVLIAQRAMLLSLAGDRKGAREELDRLADQVLSPEALETRPWRLVEALVEAQATYDIASGQSRSRELLAQAIERAEATQNMRSEIRFRRLRVAMAPRTARASDASADLARLASLEAASGFTRSRRLYASPAALGDGLDEGASAAGPIVRQEPDYFTPRERDVIAGLERGLSDKSIAAKLGITAHGVRYHLKRIYAKLNAADRREAREKAGRLRIDCPTTKQRSAPTNL